MGLEEVGAPKSGRKLPLPRGQVKVGRNAWANGTAGTPPRHEARRRCNGTAAGALSPNHGHIMEVAVKAQEAMPQKGAAAHTGTAPTTSPADIADKRRLEEQRQKPAAGPHAKPQLTDPEKTPGAGALADPDKPRDPDATG